MSGASLFGIAVFHNRGDVLAATPVARQLKADEPGCRVVWYTSKAYENLLDGNPYVDEVVGMEGDPLELDGEIERLRAARPWTRFFTPAAYMNPEVHEGRAVFETVRDAAGLDWTVPFEFVLRLSEKERAQADRYWRSLPEGPKVLVEVEFFSDQSVWEEDFAFDLVEILEPLSPVFLFTSGNRPSFLNAFKERYPKAYWCREPFRLNAEFYNRCDLFVGVSSGISALTLSDSCRRDVLHVEVVGGWPWGAGCLGRHENLYVCYNRERYKAALSSAAVRLAGRAGTPDFSPLPGEREEGGKRVRLFCPACGSPAEDSGGENSLPWITCPRCRLVYRREIPPFPHGRNPAVPPIPSALLDFLEGCLEGDGAGKGGFRLLLAGEGGPDLPSGGPWRALDAVKVPQGEGGRIEESLDLLLAKGERPESFHGALLFHQVQKEVHPLEVLERVEYLLRPGGILLVSAPLAPGREEETFEEDWPFPERPGETVLFSPATLKGLAAQAGFFPEASGMEERIFDREERAARAAELFSRVDTGKRASLLEKIRSIGLGGKTFWLAARKRGPTKARFAPPVSGERPSPPRAGPPG